MPSRVKKSRIGCLLLLVASVASELCANEANTSIAQAQAVEEEKARASETEEERIGVVERSIVIVDDAQRVASERFGSFMGQVDGFFSNAGSDDDAVSNSSWARIRIDGVRANDEDFELKTSVKLRAVLPRTERKLKLLISTEDDDSDRAGDAQDVGGDSDASLALRFIRSARDKSDVNLDIGVRQRDGDIQYFGRLNLRFSLDLDENWMASAANSYYHYSKSGYENTLSFDFRRELFSRESVYFRTFTAFDWEKDHKGAKIGHTSGIYWQLDDQRSIAFEGLANYHTAINPGVTDRFVGHQFRVRWRHNVWRPWFFYEVWPSVAWPSVTKYRQANGILLRAEFIIGQQRR